MGAWPIKRMEELCEVTSSKRIYARELVPSGVPFLKSKEIIEKVNGQTIHSNPLFISEERFQQIVAQTGALETGDVLLTSRGTLGVPYVVSPTDRFHFADGNLTWFRKFNHLDNRYLSYFFLSPSGKAELTKCVIGSSQLAYTIAALKRIEIALPPLPLQRRIAGVLSAYNDLIKNNLRRINVLEEMAQAIYREWFIKFRFPSHEKVKMIDSPLGPIPEGWAVESIDGIANVHRGRSYRSKDLLDEGGLPFVNLKCIDRDGGFRRDGLKRYEGKYKENQKVVTGDIVMAVTDMTQERRIVARAGRVPTLDADFGVISMDLVKIEPKGGMSPEFLYGYFRGSDFADNVKQHANGANVLHLSPDRIKEYQLVLPSGGVRQRFTSFSAMVFQQIENLNRRNETLHQTRDLLLPRLISGKLDVSELDIATGQETA